MTQKIHTNLFYGIYRYLNNTIFTNVMFSPGVHIAISGMAITAILYLCGNLSYVPGIGWHTADDHMITQRVAYHFWNSGVPYYNVDSAVAANTSLFWPILLSPLYAVFSPAHAIPFVVGLSLLFWVPIIIFSVSYFSNVLEKIGVSIPLMFTPSVLSYSATGWEHIPQTLFVTVGMIGILYSSQKLSKLTIPEWAFIIICLSFLMRPDSAITILIIGSAWFITNERYRYIRTYAIMLVLLMLPVSYLFLMDIFYGSFVPNTAHLKVGGFMENVENGIGYIVSPFRSGPVPILILFNILAIKSLRKEEVVLLTAALGHLAYVVVTGGDVFGSGRLFLIYLPIMTVITISVASRNIRKHSATAEIVAYSVAIVLLLNGPRIVDETMLKRERFGEGKEAQKEQIKLAEVIKQRIDPSDGTVGLHYLGIGYHMLNFTITDFLGKAEPHIARSEAKVGPIGHNKWDYEYAFKTYDIAIIPMRIAHHEKWGKAKEKKIEEKKWMYWDVLSKKLEKNGDYRFVYPKEMGVRNDKWGVYVKTDLIEKIKR